MHASVRQSISYHERDTHDLGYVPALVIPAAYHSAKVRNLCEHNATSNATFALNNTVIDGSDLDEGDENGLLFISRGTALLLLFVYVGYLIFQVRHDLHFRRV